MSLAADTTLLSGSTGFTGTISPQPTKGTERGYHRDMEAEVHVRDVRRVETRSGKTRFVLEDSQGNEYTTFREAIGEEAERYAGRRAAITYHEEQRGSFRNVYLDSVEPAANQDDEARNADEANEADEVGWRTAIEASPWLLGSSEPDREVPPEEFFDRLKPFKDLVSEDIKGTGDEPSSEGAERDRGETI
jgi:hypothetical protein